MKGAAGAHVVAALRKPAQRRVQAILRRLRTWHRDQLETTLGRLRRAEMGHIAEDPFEVLVGTILSQRTRDEVTYEVTKRLMARFPDAPSLARGRVSEVRAVIRRVGFYNQKAPRLVEVAQRLVEEHGGRVPDDLEALLALPGVGRKTANCVLVYGFARQAIPVDTHVHRISNRLGLVRTRAPEETERALTRVLPRASWLEWNELIVSYGKAVCRPVGPRCWECVLEPLCPSSQLRVPRAAARAPRRGHLPKG